jgi:16S rRNA processing protein RimM
VDEPTIVVGKLAKAHGLKGELAVEVRSDNPDRFEPGATLFLADGRTLTVERAHRHGAKLLLTFAQAHDRTSAEQLQGELLLIPESWLPSLPEGEYWPFQLEGCSVITQGGRTLGVVVEVVPNPANDLWVTRNEAGAETLIPAIRDVIVTVDVTDKQIVVRDVPGITEPDDDATRTEAPPPPPAP